MIFVDEKLRTRSARSDVFVYRGKDKRVLRAELISDLRGERVCYDVFRKCRDSRAGNQSPDDAIESVSFVCRGGRKGIRCFLRHLAKVGKSPGSAGGLKFPPELVQR